MKGLPTSLLTTIAILCLACGPAAIPVSELPDEVTPDQAIAFIHANVVPMDSERVLADRTVIIRDGRIEAVGPSSEVTLPEDVLAVDAGGQYLMPGLADMHVHVWTEADFVLYLANGVTTVRNMWGSPLHLDWRSRVASGELVGPSIYTAGLLMDGSPPIWDGSIIIETAEDANEAVREQKEAGYDFLKVYNRLTETAYQALVAAAREHEMPVAGHVPAAVGLDAALAAGQDSIEHLRGYPAATAAEGSPFVEDLSASFNERLKAMVDVARRVDAGELAFSDVYDAEKVAEYAAATRDAGVWNAPTLVVFKEVAVDEADDILSRPEMRYVDPFTKASWDPAHDPSYEGITNDEMRLLRLWNATRLQQVAALHEAGARLLLGTDTPNPFVVPGFSIHEELSNLVDSGLTPYEAIRAGTRDAAEFSGDLDEWGTIEVGKRADLILLEENPLVDVANVDLRTGIVVRGRWISEAGLRANLEELALSYEAPVDRFAELDALPSEGDRSFEADFDLNFNDVTIGGERIAIETIPGGVIVIAQAVMDPPTDERSSSRLEFDESGACQRLILRRVTSLGESVLEMVRDGGNLVITGTLDSGGTVDLVESADESALFGAPMLSPIVPVIGPLESLVSGESRVLQVKSLEFFPEFALNTYVLTASRVADVDIETSGGLAAARAFELEWSSESTSYTSTLLLDPDGHILGYDVAQDMGVMSFRRSGLNE